MYVVIFLLFVILRAELLFDISGLPGGIPVPGNCP